MGRLANAEREKSIQDETEKIMHKLGRKRGSKKEIKKGNKKKPRSKSLAAKIDLAGMKKKTRKLKLNRSTGLARLAQTRWIVRSKARRRRMVRKTETRERTLARTHARTR